jgi:tetratricopeptide (TPR) repeat protein
LKPDYTEAWDSLAFRYESLQRYDEAISAYRETVRLDPNFQRAWERLGMLLLDQGKDKEAEEPFKKSVEAAEQSKDQNDTSLIPFYWNQLAKICDKLHRKQEARDYRLSAQQFLQIP